MRAIRQTALALLTALFIQLLALSILLLLLMWPGLSALPRRHDYAEALALNWDISLPQSGACVYERDSGPSFHGDGERYHVLEYPACTALSYALPWQPRLPAPLWKRPRHCWNRWRCRWRSVRPLRFAAGIPSGAAVTAAIACIFSQTPPPPACMCWNPFFRPGLPGGSRRPFRPAPVRRK